MAGPRVNARYEIVGRLGEGQESAVFHVRDGPTDRALKVVAAAGDHGRLAAEFRRLSNLDHPRLARVHDLDTVSATDSAPMPAELRPGAAFLVADRVAGIAADRALVGARNPGITIARIGRDAASALAHLHAAGVVHCDVKPDNLVVVGTDEQTEAVLVDLGLATTAGERVTRGTVAFMAPEALGGEPCPASDIHALGATLYCLAAGVAPYGSGSTGDVLRAHARGPTRPLADAAPDMPAALAALIEQMLARDPIRRPSASAVAAELDELCRHLGAPAPPLPAALAPPTLIGRDGEIAALTALLAEGAGLVRLVGGPGAGKSAVLAAALGRHRLEVLAGRARRRDILHGAADDVARLLGVGDGARVAPERAALAWVDRVAAAVAARATPPILVLERASDDERAAALIAAAAAGHPALADALLVAELDATGTVVPLDGPVIALAPLSDAQVTRLATAMLGRRPRAPFGTALARVSGGLPVAAIATVRAAVAAEGLADADRADPAALGADQESLALRYLAGPARDPLAALAIAGGAASVPAVASWTGLPEAEILALLAGPELTALVRLEPRIDEHAVSRTAGTLEDRREPDVAGEDRARLRSRPLAEAIRAALPPDERAGLDRRALAWLTARPLSGDALVAAAAIAARVAPAAQALALATRAADELVHQGRPRAALEVLEAATTRADEHAGADPATVAEVLSHQAALGLATGAYDAALRAAGRAEGLAPSAHARARARLMQARAHQRRGDLDAAEAVLGALVDAPHAHASRGAHARLLVARGRYDEAAAITGDDDDALLVEAHGLAALYRGRPGEAAHAAERLAALADARTATASSDVSEPRTIAGRAASLTGMVAQARGDLHGAADGYERALAHARAASDVHGAAVYGLNLAAVLSERGRFWDGLDALDRALVELARVGRVAERAAALCNRANALLALGEDARAEADAAAARQAAEDHGVPHVAIYADLVSGDIARRRGRGDEAVAHYRSALARAGSGARAREQALARIALAEIQAEGGDREAVSQLAAIDPDSLAGDDRPRLVLGRARVALRGVDGAPALEVAELADQAAAARARGALDLAWRAELLAARLALATGDLEAARTRADAARRQREALLAEAPGRFRDGLDRDPDARALAVLRDELGAHAAGPGGPGGPAESVWLRRLLALGRRLNAEHDLPRLLDEVIDAAIEITRAERGFLLLHDADGRLRIEVARNFGKDDLDDEERRVSLSIAERAAHTGAPVLTVDAAFDDRFEAAASVAALRLRSVLALPLRQKSRIIGTLYLDHRFRAGAFDETAVELLRELGDIAAVTIENARLLAENRARQREVQALSERLEAQVAAVEAELVTVRARLPGDRRGFGAGYDELVGSSAAMLALLSTIDRMADAELPVVIHGESGTGKELVARALHRHSRRAGRPLLAINCGAVPESLLESELFGHVRGAFTGADRLRRGLFEVASGGTLLLDEIADTSLAMQAKLLRVLQEGEIRRLGEERPRRVDVRVLAASNRDLAACVRAGTMREDLYFRLEVLRIDVPSLRERLEDVPLLAEHLLARIAGDGPPARLTRAALARLCEHRWPGNVRELENQLARAAALSDGVIDADDLHLAPAVVREAPAPDDDLRLKPRLEALERSLIEAAMARTGGNQSAAARLLGVSRYGLQKKLKRLTEPEGA